MAERKLMQTGDRHNRLTFLADYKVMYGEWFGYFQCECGNIVERRIHSVRNGLTKSCGCFKTEQLSSRMGRKRNEKYSTITQKQ
jgi:hypothetical protein